MLAAEAGNLDLARMLVERGADPELLDNAGRTALHLALVRSGDDVSRFGSLSGSSRSTLT